MLKYIDKNEYKELLGVDSIPDNFENYVIDASTYINFRTFNRIDENDLHENVKYATALIIEKIENAEKLKQEVGNLKSQNIEGWSESYSTPEEIEKKLEEDKIKIIKTFLFNVIGKDGQPLLYCGV
jgi:hypothetical protein